MFQTPHRILHPAIKVRPFLEVRWGTRRTLPGSLHSFTQRVTPFVMYPREVPSALHPLIAIDPYFIWVDVLENDTGGR